MLRPHHGLLAHFGAAENHQTIDLICTASASKKRSRDTMDPSQQYIPHRFNMQHQSSYTIGWLPSATPAVGLPTSQALLSQFYQQRTEIDSLAERMRSELEAMGKRQCRDTLSNVRQQVLKMMKDKDAEFERKSRRNTELEQKVRDLATERLIWFTAAKNSEALACHLKSTLEQALQNAASTVLSDDCDAESCCYRGVDGREELRRRTACKVCGEKDVSALILPCRHLCLCKDCEPMFNTCPVCHSTKSGCLQIFLS